MTPVVECGRRDSEAPGGQPPNASAQVHRRALCELQHAVIVAMAGVPMVQVPGNEMVDVVAVTHRLVIAAVNVPVGGLVSATGVARRARIGVQRRDGHAMLVNVRIVLLVQVAVVQIVGVAFMLHGGMAAIRTVLVIVILVGMITGACLGHDFLLVKTLATGANQVVGWQVIDLMPESHIHGFGQVLAHNPCQRVRKRIKLSGPMT